MKKFRRSGKSSSTNKSVDLRPQYTSTSEKNLVAIQPPKKVIRALYDYQVPDPHNNTGYLSFSQGDFLHVVGRENDPDWYEACNPLHDTRGLVPANFFEEIGKQAPKGANRSSDRASGSHHDSGYAEKASQRGSVNGEAQDGQGQGRVKSTGGRSNVANIYGAVLYDFKAERPDELDAKAGENVVVIAQSTLEWFVAKPITRLGGPGLIPASFVEIRDTSTGLPVTDIQQAIKKAGIPRVEEWKKMVADYKASSIPLGRLDTPQGQHQALTQSMERLNIAGNPRSPPDTNQSVIDAQRNAYRSPTYSQQSPQQQQFRTSQMISPVRAKVSDYSHDEVDFWFTVEAVMEDGRTWCLQRSYKDFYGLQLHLIEQFPEAAGKVEGYHRTLPYMPGPVPWVTENLTSERRGHLDKYIRDLLKIDPIITNSQVVRHFFYPREGDFQLQPDDDEMSRLSGGSQSSSAPAASSAHTSSGTSGLSIGASQSYGTAQRQAPGGGQKLPPTQNRARSGSNANGLAPPPSLSHKNSSTSDMSANPGNQAASNSNATPVKVKVWFGESNCVIIRLAPDYDYDDLVGKLRDRWSLEPAVDETNAQSVNFAMEYRDDETQQFYRIESDEDLAIAKERNEKITLRVAAVTSSL